MPVQSPGWKPHLPTTAAPPVRAGSMDQVMGVSWKSGQAFLAQAFEMPGQAWGKRRSPVLPSEFFPQPTFRQRAARPGDLALARCGVRDRAVPPVGVSHDWLRGSALLLPTVALPMLALPDLRPHPPTPP